jgi:hypothetical protein
MREYLPLTEEERTEVPAEPDTAGAESQSLPPEAVVRQAPVAGPRHAWWLDFFACLILFMAAFPVRWSASTGDLWLDEADYAFASVRGFQANRWDAPELRDPQRLLRLRHYHPPLTAYAVAAAGRWGKDDRTLRVPFILAGCLTVSLLYLCGVSLFAEQARSSSRSSDTRRSPYLPRLVSLVCAVVLIATPAHIRASSHALPWAFITLWLVALTWTLLKYGETRGPGWIVAVCAVLGGLFITSEYLFPVLLALLVAAPFLLWNAVKEPAGRKRIALALAGGVAVFLVIAWSFWPAGLTGGAATMLRHYMEMADDSWPVKLRGHLHDRAPKWAYAWWYWDMYRPYLLFYATGAAAVLALALRRRLTAGAWAFLAVTAVVLAVAHKSHIIGPEYMVHGVTLLTLVGGLFLQAVMNASTAAGLVASAVAVGGILPHVSPRDLNGMDARARHPRWEQAARFLASRWQDGDRVMAPAYGGVGRWYLLHVAKAPAKEWQVQALPEAKARPKLVSEVATGAYRFVVVGSTFNDWCKVDPSIDKIIQAWPVVWQSDEGGTGPCRLRIHERPRGVHRAKPAAGRIGPRPSP